MPPLDDQLSRLLKSAAGKSHQEPPAAELSGRVEDAVIRAWREAAAQPAPGWFDGVLGPGVALAGAAAMLALVLNYQTLSELRDSSSSSQTVEWERLIADSSTQLALLP